MNNTQMAKAIGCSREHIRLITLPYDGDEPPRRPSQKLRQKIAAYTKGEVGLNDWDHAPARPYAPRGEAVAS